MENLAKWKTGLRQGIEEEGEVCAHLLCSRSNCGCANSSRMNNAFVSGRIHAHFIPSTSRIANADTRSLPKSNGD